MTKIHIGLHAGQRQFADTSLRAFSWMLCVCVCMFACVRVCMRVCMMCVCMHGVRVCARVCVCGVFNVHAYLCVTVGVRGCMFVSVYISTYKTLFSPCSKAKLLAWL